MLDHHHTVVRSIPVTTLPRTIFDLGGWLPLGPLDRLVEVGLRTRSCSVGALYRVLADLGGRGRPGTVAMRTVLERRGPDYVPTESELDRLGRAAIGVVPGMEWQVELGDEQGYIRRVDGFHPASGVVLEWDGARFHDLDRQRELDQAGDLRLAAMGLRVHRFRWFQVTEDPASVRRAVRLAVAGEALAA